MSADATNLGRSGLRILPAEGPRGNQSGRFVRLSQLRKLRECEQVAAVCYRVRGDTIEFLLVRTRGSKRWTFPKGSAEPGLTHAQAAALEAFEEAGVHGRIEEPAFAHYVRRERCVVNAHLCEVLRLSTPNECDRNRTWFSVQDAKRRLQEGRTSKDGAEFTRVIERAVARIQRIQGGRDSADDGCRDERWPPDRPEWYALQRDGLRKVQFDFAEVYGRADGASFIPFARRQLSDTRQSSAPVVNARREVLQCEVLEFDPAREFNRNPGSPSGKKTKALGTGAKSG